MDFTSAGQFRRDDILGDVARHISGAAIDLGRILAREGATAVTSHSSVGVHDDLPPGKAAVSLGASHHETTRGVDMKNRALVEIICGDDSPDNAINHGFSKLAVLHVRGVLCRDDHALNSHGPSLAILDRHLRFAVGPDKGGLSSFPDLGQILDQTVGHLNREGHQFRRLITGVAEHHSLVPRPLLFVEPFSLCHPLRDVRGLLFYRGEDGAGVTVETYRGIGVTDVAYDIAGYFVVADLGLAGNLTSDDDHPGLREGLTGYPAVWIAA